MGCSSDDCLCGAAWSEHLRIPGIKKLVCPSDPRARAAPRGPRTPRGVGLLVLVLVLVQVLAAVPDLGTPGSWNSQLSELAQGSVPLTVANTTATFDAGTKSSTGTTSDYCENVTSPALLQLNNSGSYQGVGLTTGSANCATGAWGISQTKLAGAFDMQTLRTGKLRDFSPNSYDGTIIGAGFNFPKGQFGNAASAKSNATSIQAIPPTAINGSGLSVMAWVKIAQSTPGQTFQVIFQSHTDCTDARDSLRLNSPAGGTPNQVWAILSSGASCYNGQVNFPFVIGVEYAVASIWTGTQLKVYVNGTQINSVLATGSLNVAKWSSGLIAGTVGGTAGSFMGSLDELLVLNRTASPSEITAFSTDGRPSFLSSGSWSSPAQPQSHLVPQIVQVQADKVDASDQVAYVDVLDSSGLVIANLSGSSTSNFYQFNVPLLGAALNGWSLVVGLSGPGSSTPALISVVVIVTNPNPAGGAGPPFSIRCRFNALLVSWTCEDLTQYAGYSDVRLNWTYDLIMVADSGPDAVVSFRQPGGSWFSPDRTAQLIVTAHTATGTWSTSFQITSSELLAQIVILGLLVLVVAAVVSYARAIRDRDVYFMSVQNPSYRETAISVEEYPRGWRSYRQHDPDKYVRLRSETRAERRRHPNRWTIYGIRPATSEEQRRTGRKYVAEPQTVRERM